MNRTELTFADILQFLLRHLLLIIIVTAVAGAGTFLYTKYRVPKTYMASVSLLAVGNTNQDSEVITYGDQTGNITLANTYAIVLKSNTVMQEVSQKLEEKGLHYSDSALSGMVTTGINSRTWVFSATVSAGDPDDAKTIADTLADVASYKIAEVIGSGEVRIVDYSKRPLKASSPNVSRNAMIGAVVGLLLSCAFAIIHELTDTTIWTEDNLTKRFNVPVLGIVPLLSAGERPSKKE